MSDQLILVPGTPLQSRAVFRASRVAPLTIADGALFNTDTIIPFDSVEIDNMGAYNPTTGEYTVATAGIYFVSTGITVEAIGGVTRLNTRIFNNFVVTAFNSVVINLDTLNPPFFDGLHISTMIELPAGRVIRIEAGASNPSGSGLELAESLPFFPRQGGTYFNIYQVS